MPRFSVSICRSQIVKGFQLAPVWSMVSARRDDERGCGVTPAPKARDLKSKALIE